MVLYQTHGLTIFSEIDLPELTVKKSNNTDFNILFRDIKFVPKNNQKNVSLSKFVTVQIVENVIQFLWNNTVICNLDSDNNIIINLNTGLEESFLRYFIYGNVFPIILHRKGRLVLHANAVDIDGRGVVFLGVSGTGKSTISLALHKKGYSLLSDDVLSIKINMRTNPIIYPGFPRMKLWPNVIENINENPKVIPKVHDYTSKRFYNISNEFSHETKHLKNIFILDKGSKTIIKDINPSEAVIELIRSSYCYKLFNKKELSENFQQCTKLVNCTSVKKLEINHSFEDINNLVNIIKENTII